MTEKKGTEGITGVVKLNSQQRTFVNEWLRTNNAEQAKRAAGYSEKTDSWNILNGEKIQRYLQDYWKNNGMGPEEVTARLSQQARAEYAGYFKAEGGMFDLDQMLADGKGHLIKSIKQTRDGVNIEFYDAQSALVHIGRTHGMFTDRTELSGSVERPITVIDYGLDGDDLDDDLEADNWADSPTS